MFGRRRKEESSSSPPSAAAGGSSKNEAAANSNKPGRRRRKLDDIPARRNVHKVFILIAVLTSLCALSMAVGQILGTFVYENTVVTYVLRGYVILLCGLVLLIELEWPRPVRETPIFRNWVTRGLLYAFIGVVGMQENESSDVVLTKDSEAYEMMSDVVIAVAWNMIGCGLLYIVMGLLCLHYVLNRLREDYQERLQLARERQNEDDDIDVEEGAEGDAVLQELNSTQSAFVDVENQNIDWPDDNKSEETSKKKEAEGKEKRGNEDPDQPSWANDNSESVTEKSSTDEEDGKKLSVDADNKQPSWAKEEDDASSKLSIKESLSRTATKEDDDASSKLSIKGKLSKTATKEDDDASSKLSIKEKLSKTATTVGEKNEPSPTEHSSIRESDAPDRKGSEEGNDVKDGEPVTLASKHSKDSAGWHSVDKESNEDAVSQGATSGIKSAEGKDAGSVSGGSKR